MELGSLEHLNRLAGAGQEWLGEGFASHFQRLSDAIKSMLRPDDEVVVPDARQPFAWRAAWPIYERLRQRQEADSVSNAAASEATIARRAHEEESWARYLRERTELSAALQKSRIAADAMIYLELEDGDFVDPVDPDNHFDSGKRAGWRDRAHRISHAVGKWNRLTVEQRSLIPDRVATWRAAKTAANVDAIVEHLRKHDLEKHEQRMDAYETRIAELEVAILAVAAAKEPAQ
jgi:hypothetical protein